MTGAAIKEKVVVKLEEFSPYAPDHADAGPLLSGQDALDEVKPIYSYIDETLPQAANEILLVAPLDKLTSSSATASATVYPDSNRLSGYIQLPSDYLRLASLRMDTWTRTLHLAARVNTPIALAQDNQWTMGTPQKPIVVQEEGYLHYYSVKKDARHTIREFLYIPVFSETREYADNVAELIALNCAKKVYEVFQNTEGVQMMASEIKSAMEALAL